MRIVLDLQACQASNRDRGIGRYSLSLAQAMVRQATGHDVRIVLNSRLPDSVAAIRATFDGLLPQSHISVFDVPVPVAEITPDNAWRTRSAERVREAYLAALKPDIVHVASLFEGLVDDAVTSAGLLQTPFPTAATLYDLIPLLRKETYLQDARVQAWYYRKLQWLKNADLLLAISAHTRREAVGALYLPADRVVNISGAADSLFRPLDISPAQATALGQRYGLVRPFVMYTGGIDSRKNIEGLIEAFAQLPGALRSSYQLAIVCKAHEADRQRLLDLAQRAGLAAQDVVFTGYVPDSDLAALYNCCALFVFPSLHEGFGLPALEAMACGAAVIGANNSSIPEVIGREDALFDATDTGAMAYKMHQALTEPGFLASLKTHGLQQAQRFSWDASANIALDALVETRRTSHAEGRTVRPTARRARLAYVSPLPPAKSGIADYSAELLPELARYYDIEIVSDQEAIADPMVASNFPQRSVAWFDRHAGEYDHVMYHFGNSSHHQHMFDLLDRHPGIVVLHDFFLSGIMSHIDHHGIRPFAFPLSLYRSHGYTAMLLDKTDRGAAIWKYPSNKEVLDQATGVIAHSAYASTLARQWYRHDTAEDWQTIPLLRAFPPEIDRQAARRQLGITDEDFVVCSFGIMGPTKLNDRLLTAWLQSPLADDNRCHLIFVGHNDTNPYCRTMAGFIARARTRSGDRVRITGFVTPEDYRCHLAAADVAVQLRSMSRGETSASILDCLAFGLPTIINANGAATELPDDVLVKLDDEFDNADLRAALATLWQDRNRGSALGQRALEFVRRDHHPARIGRLYRDAVEAIAASASQGSHRALAAMLAHASASTEPTRNDVYDTAAAIAANRPSQELRQMFVDVSELVQRDAKSGIQRVVRNILAELIAHPPAGCRIEPVYDNRGTYCYAREFTLRTFGLPSLPLGDDPIEAHAGDIFLGLDLNPGKIPDNERLLLDLRNRGVEMHFVIYDLLPFLRPDVFVAGAKEGFTRWLAAVTRIADGVVCISRAVADEFLAWHAEHGAAVSGAMPRLQPLKVGYFHLGADINADAVATLSGDAATDEDARLAQIKARPSLLMVGTLEPRKGHAHALAAFDLLWEEGTDANLVIVGKQGWLVDEVVERLRTHPESGKRLFWFEGASDAMLLRLYADSAALLAASEAEGFGLPLIEAAQYGIPIIARDIPVFREVAQDNAFYFSGSTARALADAVQAWLRLRDEGRAPGTAGLRWLTWAQSAQQLLDAVERDKWYRVVPADRTE